MESRVVDSRYVEESNAIRRRRECTICGKRFTTYEKIEVAPIIVIKKDGRREEFDPAKLKRGISRACEKRPVSEAEISHMVNDIERELRNMDTIEVPSSVIGEMVMDRLRDLDHVAYIRFASVYREFADVEMFEEEIRKILRETARGKRGRIGAGKRGPGRRETEKMREKETEEEYEDE